MVHRLALLLGGVGAAAVLALALNLGGFIDAPTAATAAVVSDGSPVAATAPDSTRTVIDRVYVEAAPKPEVVHANNPPRVSGPNAGRPRGDERERDDDEQGERGERGERGEQESD